VVLVDFEVPGRLDRQVEQRVRRERAKQVVVEADAGRDAGVTRAVQVETNQDVRLARRAANLGAAAVSIGHRIASRSRWFSAGVRTVSRR
jgi:hypothetical protein